MIDEKLKKQLRKLITKYNKCQVSKNELDKELKKLGFIRKPKKWGSGRHLFVHDTLKLVLKEGYFIHEIPAEIIKDYCIMTDVIFKNDNHYIWVLQPLVNVERQHNAYKSISKKLRNMNKRDLWNLYDFKDLNCGYYKRKAIILDW